MLNGSLSRKTWLAWIALGVGLLATIFASLQVKQGIEQEVVSQFAFTCDQITLKVQERLGTYALILRGGALFAASVSVERKEWRTYVETLQAGGNVPGVQGIGFAPVITADQLASHIATIRAEGFPEYTIRPPGERAIYTPIVYLEPFLERNLRAFGFDMYSEPVRRAALEQARDTGAAALSGKVELVQETGTEVQAGALMYVPVYRSGMPKDTVGQRRAALIGWTYSPYRMDDLMTGILSDWVHHEGKTVDLTIYDGREATPATLLFDSIPANLPDEHSLFYQQRTIDFNGHQWLLVFDHPVHLSGFSYAPVLAAPTCGLALSGLLFGLMLSVINTKATAARIADKLTEEIRRDEELLKKSDVFKFAILNSLPAEIAVVNREGTILAVNELWWRFALENGIDPFKKPATNTDIGANYLVICRLGTGFITSPDVWEASSGVQAVLEGSLPSFSMEYLRPTPTQQQWISMTVLPLGHEASRGVVISHTDITERKQAEEKLQLSASAFTHAHEGIMLTAADGTIVDVNDAFSHITSYSRDEVLGQNPRLLSSGLQDKAFYAAMWSDLVEKGYWYGEVWNRRKNGKVYAVMQTISAVRDAQGNIRHYVSLLSDITLIKEHERELDRNAHYDALTGLPNRVLLADRLHQGIAQTRRRGQLLAVAFLDLDGFKDINDNYGHEAGDQLLIAVATRMKQTLRESDTLARIGGDEFVAELLDLANIEASEPLLIRLLAAAAEPVYFGDHVLQVSASLGVTFYPQAEDIDADQLLRQADQAMYQAKLAGKNRYHVFDAK
jgi:diguanylate cyclase (GGDEF)-like protein/PAS domain S-box-containing protein